MCSDTWATGLYHAALHAVIHKDLKMKEMHAQCVPSDLMPKQHQMRMPQCRELLMNHSKDPKDFVRLITGEKSWFH
jgi:Fe2+ transport system protein B